MVLRGCLWIFFFTISSFLLQEQALASETKQPAADSASAPLQGGVSHGEVMQPSVNVQVPPPRKPANEPISGSIESNRIPGTISVVRPGPYSPRLPLPGDTPPLKGLVLCNPSEAYDGFSSIPHAAPLPVYKNPVASNGGWASIGPGSSGPVPVGPGSGGIRPCGVQCWLPEYRTQIVYRRKPYFEHSAVGILLPSRHPRIVTRDCVGLFLPTRPAALTSPPKTREETATAISLPAVQAHVATNWDEWYKTIAGEIYKKWRARTGCAGTATVSVTVFDSRDVDPLILNFRGISDSKVDAADQSAFCRDAIKSVAQLNRYQFWQFPESKDSIRKLKLNIQFTREVGGTAGCQVSKGV